MTHPVLRATVFGGDGSPVAVLLLLFGLLRSGQITLRRLVGSKDMPAVAAGATGAGGTGREAG